MTVAELIALLSTMPQELPVTVPSWEWQSLGEDVEVRADDVEVIAEGFYCPHPDGEPVGDNTAPGPHVRIG